LEKSQKNRDTIQGVASVVPPKSKGGSKTRRRSRKGKSRKGKSRKGKYTTQLFVMRNKL
jgi:hypothetical protein